MWWWLHLSFEGMSSVHPVQVNLVLNEHFVQLCIYRQYTKILLGHESQMWKMVKGCFFTERTWKIRAFPFLHALIPHHNVCYQSRLSWLAQVYIECQIRVLIWKARLQTSITYTSADFTSVSYHSSRVQDGQLLTRILQITIPWGYHILYMKNSFSSQLCP